MPIEKVLIEFAKIQLQLITANEQIAVLQAQIKALLPKEIESNAPAV